MTDASDAGAAGRLEMAALVAWHIDAGADEAVAGAPVDRFRAPAPRPEGAPAPPPPAPAPRRRAGPAPLRSGGQVVLDAGRLAEGASTLDGLRAAFEGFDGCALRTTATRFVFSDGDPEAALMLVGEAPGADEDRQGVPFVGAAGRLLDLMLASIGVGRGGAYITNIVPWRPPGNRTPGADEVAMCLPFAARHIELVMPRLLVPLGAVAAKALLDTTEGITRLRGQRRIYKTPSGRPVPVRPMLHPAYLLRRPEAKRLAWRDLRDIRRDLEEAGG